jgi:hypothetical protein
MEGNFRFISNYIHETVMLLDTEGSDFTDHNRINGLVFCFLNKTHLTARYHHLLKNKIKENFSSRPTVH